MGNGYSPRPDGVQAGMSRQTIRIYLKHHTNPSLAPRSVTCQDYENPRTKATEKGCGGSVVRFATYPRGKGMRFDSAPEVVEGSETNMGDGSIVASVYTDNVHFSTCPVRKRKEPEAATTDSRQYAAGE